MTNTIAAGDTTLLTDYETALKETDPDFNLVGRNTEMRELSNILLQRHNNNVLLTGPAGVGRTAIVKGLTERKSRDDMPVDILGRRFMKLDVNALFDDDNPEQIKASFEKIIADLEKGGNRILVIDDFKDFMDGMENNNCHGLMPRLMGALRRNAFQSILLFRDEHLGAVTNLHSDVRELFTVQKIEETSQKDTLEILRGAAPAYEKHHGIKISDDALREAAGLTDRYRTDALSSAQPGRALQLLDMAASEFRLDIHSGPAAPDDPQAAEEWKARRAALRDNYLKQIRYEEKLADLKEKLAAKISAQEQKAEAEAEAEKPLPAGPRPAAKGGWSEMFTATVNGVADMIRKETPAIVKLREHVQAYERELKGLREQFQGMTKIDESLLVLKPEHIQAEFSQISGVPVKKMNVDETQKLLNAETHLGERIVGQDHALAAVSEAIRRSRAGLRSSEQKPIGSFLFLGPSGVGKTELCKALAAFLHEDERSLIRLDMSEYKSQSAVQKMIGADPGLVGYEEGGKLTNAVAKRPGSVVLFDEGEKAHPEIFDLLLQVLDDGRLTDSKGKTVDFRDTVVVLTSNFGSDSFLDESISYEEACKRTRDELYESGKFRPEFLNRFDEIVFFNRLTPDNLVRIVRNDIEKLSGQLRPKNIDLTMDDGDISMMARETYVAREGARGPKRFVTKNIRNQMAARVLQMDGQSGGQSGGQIDIHFDPIEKNVRMEFIDRAANAPAAQQKETPQAPAAFGQGGLAPKPAVPAP